MRSGGRSSVVAADPEGRREVKDPGGQDVDTLDPPERSDEVRLAGGVPRLHARHNDLVQLPWPARVQGVVCTFPGRGRGQVHTGTRNHQPGRGLRARAGARTDAGAARDNPGSGFGDALSTRRPDATANKNAWRKGEVPSDGLEGARRAMAGWQV